MSAAELSTTDPSFLGAVRQWIAENGEVCVVFRYPACGGYRDYMFFESFEGFESELKTKRSQTSVIVMRLPQLKIRGIVDDSFVSTAMAALPDNTEFKIVRLGNAKTRWKYGAGENHADLLKQLNERRGEDLALGQDPPWHLDNPDTLEAIVPLPDGTIKRSVY